MDIFFEYLRAFLCGGILCAIGQILIDKTPLTPAKILVAYVVSGGGFALYCVWQLVFSYGRVDLRYLLLAMRWLPAGLALTWCCDRSRSVWAAVLLHGTIDGVVLLRTLSAA